MTAIEQDEYVVAVIENVRFDVMAALARGDREVTITASPLMIAGLLDDMLDRKPRNFSMLLRDHTIDRLEGAIARLVSASDLVERAAFMVIYSGARRT